MPVSDSPASRVVTGPRLRGTAPRARAPRTARARRRVIEACVPHSSTKTSRTGSMPPIAVRHRARGVSAAPAEAAGRPAIARHIVASDTRSPVWSANAAVCSARVASAATSSQPGSQACSRARLTGNGPCRCAVGATLPVARRRASNRSTDRTDTANRSAPRCWSSPRRPRRPPAHADPSQPDHDPASHRQATGKPLSDGHEVADRPRENAEDQQDDGEGARRRALISARTTVPIISTCADVRWPDLSGSNPASHFTSTRRRLPASPQISQTPASSAAQATMNRTAAAVRMATTPT